MRFTKMQGLGNDYIYVNCLEGFPKNLPALARAVSDRHFGVGSDGLIAIGPGRMGDFAMEMFNADGSRGEMCGNGIRCVGKYVYDKRLTDKTRLTIDTGAGPRQLTLRVENGRVAAVTVDMGGAFLFPDLSISLDGEDYTGSPVSVGNPHFVIFCSDPEAVALAEIGPRLERHPLFPGRTNVEFVSAGEEGLTMRVWERGSGETLACGTGACAGFAAARVKGLCGNTVKVRLRGGVLDLELDERTGHTHMTGPAVTVFEGEWPDTFS